MLRPYRQSITCSEFLPMPRRQARGAFRIAARISFVTFICPPKKSKEDRDLQMIISAL